MIEMSQENGRIAESLRSLSITRGSIHDLLSKLSGLSSNSSSASVPEEIVVASYSLKPEKLAIMFR